jgi:hypothetical protein
MQALSRCPILVIASPAKDVGRQAFVEELRVCASGDDDNSSSNSGGRSATSNTSSLGSDALHATFNDITFSVQSFPTKSRSKRDKLKLAGCDPAVIVFVVDCIAASNMEDEAVVELREALHHLMFVCRAIGTATEVSVQLVFTNVDEFEAFVGTGDFAIVSGGSVVVVL